MAFGPHRELDDPSDERVLPVGLKNRSTGTGTTVSQSECDGEKNGHLTPTPGFAREAEKGSLPGFDREVWKATVASLA